MDKKGAGQSFRIVSNRLSTARWRHCVFLYGQTLLFVRHECCFSESDLHHMAARLSMWTNNLLLLFFFFFQHLSIIFPQKKSCSIDKTLHWKLSHHPLPRLNNLHVLVKLNYAGVIFIDIYQQSGLYPMQLPLKMGCEGAGTLYHAAMYSPKLLHLVLQDIILFN